MPPDGFHEVRRHIRRNPRPRGKKLGFWTIAGIAAFVWLWGQVIGFDTSSSGAETDRPASPLAVGVRLVEPVMGGIRLRAPRGRREQVAAGIVALALATMLVQAATGLWHAIVRGWPLAVAAAVAALLAAVGWQIRRTRQRRAQAALLAVLRLPLVRIDALSDTDFEFALRDLLIRDGWSAQQVGQAGDQAADVIGRHTQCGRIVLQAKHTTVGGKVGSQVMYQVKGTARPVHKADVAVVVTNGGFTRDAKAWGERHQIHWVDRDRLRQWAEDGVPLHTLLRLPARRPRRTTVRRGRVT